MAIEIIEKEGWYNDDRITGHCMMYPTYMVKDGKEHFMFNRPSTARSRELEANEARKQQLLNDDGKFMRFYGLGDHPFDFLRMVVERRHTFERFSYHDELDWSKSKDYCDFHGNLREVSAAFKYRLYDEELIGQVAAVVQSIKKKDYARAGELLEEYSLTQDGMVAPESLSDPAMVEYWYSHDAGSSDVCLDKVIKSAEEKNNATRTASDDVPEQEPER